MSHFSFLFLFSFYDAHTRWWDLVGVFTRLSKNCSGYFYLFLFAGRVVESIDNFVQLLKLKLTISFASPSAKFDHKLI